MIYVCLVKADGKIYLLTNEDGTIMGGETEEARSRLLEYWTGGWERGLGSGSLGFSTGAMMSFIFFSPSVVSVSDLDALREVIGRKEPYSLLRIRGEGGWFDGFGCDSENAMSLWEAGEKPVFFRDVIEPTPGGYP